MPRLIDADQLKDPLFLLGVDNYGLSEIIEALPTVEAEPIKHGEWRADEMSYTVGETWCSVCRTQYYIDDLYNVGENDLPNYCPHCGAKMDEEAAQ